MKIIDTFNKIFDCFENNKFNVIKYQQYADSVLPNLHKKLIDDVKHYDFKKEILPVILNAFRNKEKLDLTHKIFLKVTENLQKSVYDILGEEIDLTIVLYLGLCNGAGWATEVNGKKVVLIGIEKIVELDWCDERIVKGLIYHEIGHIIHFNSRLIKDELINSKEKSLYQLYTEGFAMYVEQLLCRNDEFYHQNKKGWLDWCRINQKRLYKAYITKINNNESTQDFFGDWNSIEAKSDVGYYLGCELIRSLSSVYSLKELANLSLSVIEIHLKQRCVNV